MKHRPLRSLARLTPAVLIAMALHGPVQAQDWADLDAGQQALLAPWSDRWDGLDRDQKAELLDNAERWSTMSAEERAQVRRRLEDWNALTAEEKARLRERADRLRSMPPEQQQRLREAQRRLESLPPEQRARIRERWEEMSPRERRAFLMGMQAQRRADARDDARDENRQWRRLLSEQEREGLRALWESLPRPDRRRLMLRMRDLDDEARADLARALIEADPGERRALIRGD